jgi:hypothetical protein
MHLHATLSCGITLPYRPTLPRVTRDRPPRNSARHRFFSVRQALQVGLRRQAG